MPDAVTDNTAASRYELEDAGETAIAAYRREGDVMVFTHTAVPDAVAGHGVGSRLIAGALDDVRRHGLSVRPDCPFVADYMQRHPETQDLLADGG